MRIRKLHPWDITTREAMALQRELQPKIVLKDGFSRLRLIAAADISYSKHTGRSYGGAAVFTYPDLELMEEHTAYGDSRFPYVPGLLSFREGPVLLEALRKIKQAPDLLLFDGQGIAHPRGFGLASHLGLIVNRPSIGCAKSLLYGQCREPGKIKGDNLPIQGEGGRIIGAVLRTRDGVNPVYVSQGHKISLKTAIEIILACCKGYRIPQPLRHAHQLVNRLRAEMETGKDTSGLF